MNRTVLSACITSLVVLSAAVPCLAQSNSIPLGHKDFYPSVERPVGYRGDGNGYFPGATPVKVFYEGTPAEKEHEYKGKRGMTTGKYIAMTDDRSKNIVWKAEMPSWANSHPIVVGDKVFTIGEPDMLICTDARTGKVLWSRRNNVWSTFIPDEALAERLYEMFQIYLAVDAVLDAQFTDRTPRLSPEKYRPIREMFVKHSLPRITEAMAKLDPGKDYGPQLKQMVEGMDLFLADAKNYGKAKGILRGKHSFTKTLASRIDHLGGKKINLDIPWGNMVGWCMSVPASDGQRVYASFGQGHTVCYDLEGRLLWRKFVQIPTGRTDSIQSPLLSSGVLVDMHGGAGVLRGLDAETGKTLWEAPTASSKLKKNKGGYYVGSHKIIRLANKSATPMDVVVTTLCNIIRVKDGEVVGHLPWEWNYGPSGGPSIFNSGNIVFRAANGDGGGSPFTAYKLQVTGPDQVTATQIYSIGKKGSPGYHGQIATETHVIMTSDEANILEAATGKVLRKGGRRSGLGELSNILAGDLMIWADKGHRDPLMSYWGRRRWDGKTALRFYAADMSDLSSPKRVDQMNVLGGENIPRFPAFEKYVNELYQARKLWGAWNGLPSHFMHTGTGIYPHGNRLFVRSVSHLYCIGDPSEEWHTPAGAPGPARTAK